MVRTASPTRQVAPPLRRVGGFRSARAGVAAIEFAVALPALAVLLLAGLQAVTYVRAARKVELFAASMGEMLSQAAPPAGSTLAAVAAGDLHFAYDAGLVIFPSLMADAARQNIAWWQDVAVAFAAVQFSATGATCPAGGDQSACFRANVVWTSSGLPRGNARPCGVPQQPTDSPAPSSATLPRGVFGAGSLIVIDVSFTFRPSFGGRLLPAQRIARSVYLRPRYASLITFDPTNNDGIAARCAGY